jgi:hypothetical protein
MEIVGGSEALSGASHSTHSHRHPHELSEGPA